MLKMKPKFRFFTIPATIFLTFFLITTPQLNKRANA